MRGYGGEHTGIRRKRKKEREKSCGVKRGMIRGCGVFASVEWEAEFENIQRRSREKVSSGEEIKENNLDLSQ